MHLIDRTATGHMLAVAATGKIALYQAFLGGSLILTLPVAWLFVHLNWGIYATGWAMILTMMLCAWGRVWFARTIAGMSAWYWVKKIFFPLVILFSIVLIVGILPQIFLPASIVRVIITTLVCEFVLLPLTWKFAFNGQEKRIVCDKLKGLRMRLTGG